MGSNGDGGSYCFAGSCGLARNFEAKNKRAYFLAVSGEGFTKDQEIFGRYFAARPPIADGGRANANQRRRTCRTTNRLDNFVY